MSLSFMPSSSGFNTGKIIYINGMTTGSAAALEHCKKIEEMSGRSVELLHNDTTPTAKAVFIGAGIGAGLVALSLKDKDDSHPTVKVIGAALIGAALGQYASIQTQKNAHARTLKDKVITYLHCNPKCRITLIFHSQGADIGNRALKQLSSYKDRIHVITLGGMVSISDDLASRVTNLQDENDLISMFAQTVFSLTGPNPQRISHRACLTFACHGADDYLSHRSFHGALSGFNA
jgi:hypothetical protein